MAISSSISNVIIEGNTFAAGVFSGNTYNYSNCITTSADAKITKNYFSGMANNSTPLIVSNFATNNDGYSASCDVSHNTFVRGNTTIAAYIDVSNVHNDQIIVENIFDSPTVDGVNETLTLLPAVTSSSGPFVLYERNKNQTAIKQIQKSQYLTASGFTPTINQAERAVYTDNTNSIYNQAGGYYYAANYTLANVKNEGVAMNYITPYNPSSAIKLSGPFALTNGSSTVGVIASAPGVITNTLSGTINGYIIFGNDNNYYTATITTGSNGILTGITLSTYYVGNSNTSESAIFIQPTASPLSYVLPGTFSVMSGSATITASLPQQQNLIVGSKISFNDTTGNIYTIQAPLDINGFNYTISPSYLNSTNATIGATAGVSSAYFNFSINLSEVLPENVQVISTIFGLSGNSNSSLIFANYNAHISTDTSGNYQTNLPGTFTATNNSTNITGTSTNLLSYVGFGSSICFSNQSNVVYPIQSVAGNTITLAIPFNGATASGLTATNFDNSLANTTTYTPSGGTAPFGNNFQLNISNASGSITPAMLNTSAQYLKIDPPASDFAAVTTSGRLLRYNLNIILQMATPGHMFLPESPLVVKYRW